MVGGPEMAPHTPRCSDAPRRGHGAPRGRDELSHRAAVEVAAGRPARNVRHAAQYSAHAASMS